jgi:ubiquinone/menaquinone biosynthesis C-methylase UbiE
VSDPQHIANSFNARAAGYAHDDWHKRYAEQLVAATPLRDGDRVLDAGTGTGFAAIAIAQRVGSNGHVLGVDISAGMLDQARLYARASKVENVDWLEADVTDLRELLGETFDAVVCSAGLLYMPVAKSLNAWHRLLKPNGVIAFSTMTSGSPAPGRIFRDCAARFGLHIADRFAELGSEDGCRRALEQAGFERVEIIPGRVDFEQVDLPLAWESSSRAAGREAGTLSPEQMAALREQYLAALSQAIQDDYDATARVDVLFAIGRRPM